MQQKLFNFLTREAGASGNGKATSKIEYIYFYEHVSIEYVSISRTTAQIFLL